MVHATREALSVVVHATREALSVVVHATQEALSVVVHDTREALSVVVHAKQEALSVVVYATQEEVDSRQHTDPFPAVQYQHHHCDQILQSRSDMEVDDEDTGPITSNNSKTSTVNIKSFGQASHAHQTALMSFLIRSTYLCMRPCGLGSVVG